MLIRINSLRCGIAAATALLALASGPAAAQTQWPAKPLRIVVPIAPGVAPDVFARIYADQLTKSLGQPVVIDNKPGASGIIGTDAVAKAPNDGYTVLYGFNQLVTINPHLFAKLPYNPERDLAPVTQTITGAYVILANKEFAATSMKDLIALAKAQPGRVKYASYGPGTATHLGMELIQQAAAVQLLHVPYEQNAITDVIAGVVPLIMEPSGSAVPNVKTGKLRAIAVTSGKRMAALPDVPAVAETLPGYEVVGWHGVWVPAGTPKVAIDRLSAEFIRITKLPEVERKIREVGAEPSGTTPEELAAIIRRESEVWGRIIKARNIKLD